MFSKLDNADFSNTDGHAISSEQRRNYQRTCSLPFFRLISVVTALVFGLSRHKVAHAAAGKENDPDQALTKRRLQRKRKVADKMSSLRSSNKGINAEPPAKQKSPPGRDEEPTDSQVSSFAMEAIDVDIIVSCNSRVVGTQEVSNMKLLPNNLTTNHCR